MRLVWTIKVYNTGGLKAPYRVKIEGPGADSQTPWAIGEGKGLTEAEAYCDAVADMHRKPTIAPL
jgi:hypothetical protein